MSDNTEASRRAVVKTGLALLAGGAVAGVAAQRARAQEKIAQAQVQYQTMPKDGAECDKCVNWVPPNACKIVAGNIVPKGWCVAYAPKEG